MHLPKAYNATDQYLVQQVLKGNQQAFGQIVQQTEGLIAQIVFKMVPASGDREDLVQDIYLKAFKNLAGFKFNARLSTWLGRIAYNTCLHYLEKKKLVFLPDVNEQKDEPANKYLQDNHVLQISSSGLNYTVKGSPGSLTMKALKANNSASSLKKLKDIFEGLKSVVKS